MSENNSLKVSVIMPAYNSEKYIERSVKSVLSQTHDNLELIVVDDGSTDRTASILRRLGDADARLRYVRTENHGPAEARNAALKLVCEDAAFVTFIDADDELLPDALSYALESADSGADLILMGFCIVEADGREREYNEFDCLVRPQDLKTAFARLYKANLLNQVWAKLFSAELVKDIRFPDYRWGEDRLFLFQALERAERVKILPECKHRYVMHEGESLITRYYDKKFRVCCEVDEAMERLCEELRVTEQADFRYMFAKSVFSCMTTLYARSCRLTKAEKRTVVSQIVNDPRVQRRCRACAGGLPVNLLCAVLRSRLVGLNLFVFRLVAWCGEHLPRLFTRIKHRK